MKVAIASDHAGYELKEKMVPFIRTLGYELSDLGPDGPDRVDYPDYAITLCQQVVSGQFDRGILICGTGVGMAITANKVPGIRCGSVSEAYSARRSRQHNNANVIAFGARVVGEDVAQDIVRAFLETEFEGGRHADRVQKIIDYEQKKGQA